jgi:hypothetical protein
MFFRLLLTIAVLLTPCMAGASETVPLGTLLSAVPLNGAASTLTFYVGQNVDCGRNNSCAPTSATDTSTGASIRDYDKLRLELSFDYTAQAGAITLTCTEGQTRATATGRMSTATLASGAYTLAWSGVVTTPSMSEDTIWPVVLNLRSTPVVKCVVSHGGTPGATDKITVTGWLVKKD